MYIFNHKNYSHHTQDFSQCLEFLSLFRLCRISLSLSSDSVLSVLDLCFLLAGALGGGCDGSLEVAPDGNLDPRLEGSLEGFLVPTPDGPGDG